MKLVRTQRLKIEPKRIYSELNAASASVWNECLGLMTLYQYGRGYPHAHRDFYFGNDCEGWMDKSLSKKQPLHSQSIQHIRRAYFKSWRSYAALKKSQSAKAPRPPRKEKRYMSTRWLKAAIRFTSHSVFLSRGWGRPRLEIELPKSFDFSNTHNVLVIDLVKTHGQWELHFTYKLTVDDLQSGENIVGVDIGEIHPIVSHDGENTDIYNGRYIRSLYRHRNMTLANFNSVIDGCEKRSSRWWHLTRKKWKRVKKTGNRISDALHKHTTDFVVRCFDRGVGLIVLGNLTGIRKDVDYGKRTNQKLHQWAFSKITELIVYKAAEFGIKVVQIDEAYTSQTCPKCGNRKKPTNRNYNCNCGFSYHRDGVGAINIRQKYLGRLGDPVVAAMTPPAGIRLKFSVALH